MSAPQVGAPRVTALVPCAGRSERTGLQDNKVLAPLGPWPVVISPLIALQVCPSIGLIILVARAGEEERLRALAREHAISKVTGVVIGGPHRQVSVLDGLRRLPADTEYVVIHDGARPFLTPRVIEDSLAASKSTGAAVAAVPASDTVKVAGDDMIVIDTPDRSRLWIIQTPQTFRYDLILRAHEAAAESGLLTTDDGSLVEALGHPVMLFRASRRNMKITTAEDLVIANALHGEWMREVVPSGWPMPEGT